jgi:hypothetical protein
VVEGVWIIDVESWVASCGGDGAVTALKVRSLRAFLTFYHGP